MSKEDEEALLRLVQGKDVSEVMALLMKHGNRYSRRILKFFQWFCKWMPIMIMCFHAYAIYEFSQHPREMFVPYEENMTCYLFIYFMLYILPMVIILASRFFYLCWRYRTNEMVMEHKCLLIMTAAFYLYGFVDMFINNTKVGRKICA